MEASKGKGPLGPEFALGIFSTIVGTNSIESEARHIKEALVNWQQRRGTQCKRLDLVFTVDESQHSRILEYIEMVLNYDEFISEFKKQLAIDLTLINLQGKVCKEFKFGQRGE